MLHLLLEFSHPLHHSAPTLKLWRKRLSRHAAGVIMAKLEIGATLIKCTNYIEVYTCSWYLAA